MATGRASFRARFFISTFVASITLAAVASCGSRTGLFVDVDGVLPDGTLPDGAIPDRPEDGPLACIPGRFDFELAAAQLMFVLDRSGSMAYSLNGVNPVPAGEFSRWATLRQALSDAIAPFDQQLAMGAKFFPEVLQPDDLFDPDLACSTSAGVGIPPARGSVSSILEVFDTTVPRGGTPTAEAIRIAADYLAQRRTVARTIVVATDGAPNCNEALNERTCVCTSPRDTCDESENGRYSCLDDNRTVSTIRQIADVRKIPVYVIGIGSTERPEFLQVLDAMAIAGGRPRPTAPRHYNVQTAAEMQGALTTIRESVAECTYLTPSVPTDPSAIRVEIDGQPIARDSTHTGGWDWVDQPYGALAFAGEACERAKRDGAKISGVVSCNDQ